MACVGQLCRLLRSTAPALVLAADVVLVASDLAGVPLLYAAYATALSALLVLCGRRCGDPRYTRAALYLLIGVPMAYVGGILPAAVNLYWSYEARCSTPPVFNLVETLMYMSIYTWAHYLVVLFAAAAVLHTPVEAHQN